MFYELGKILYFILRCLEKIHKMDNRIKKKIEKNVKKNRRLRNKQTANGTIKTILCIIFFYVFNIFIYYSILSNDRKRLIRHKQIFARHQ